MNINFVLPLNILLEVAMIVVQAIAYSYNHDYLYARIDQIYLGVAPAALIFSVILLIYFMSLPQNRWRTPVIRGVRACVAVGLIVVGALMIYSALDIEGSYICQLAENFVRQCQRYELKLAAGVLAIVDGIVCFLPPSKAPPSQSMISIPMGQPGAYPVVINQAYAYNQNGNPQPHTAQPGNAGYGVAMQQGGNYHGAGYLHPNPQSPAVGARDMQQPNETGYYGLGFYGTQDGLPAQQQYAVGQTNPGYAKS